MAWGLTIKGQHGRTSSAEPCAQDRSPGGIESPGASVGSARWDPPSKRLKPALYGSAIAARLSDNWMMMYCLPSCIQLDIPYRVEDRSVGIGLCHAHLHRVEHRLGRL
jgi:hypothetical protein